MRYDSGLYVLWEAFFQYLMAIFTQRLENDVSVKVMALNMQQIWEEQNLLSTQIFNLTKLFPSI